MEQLDHKMKFLLSFPDPLEQEFRRQHDEASAEQVRWVFALLWILTAITFPGDFIVGPEVFQELLLFRFGVVVPGMIFIFLMTNSRWYPGKVQAFAFAFASYGVLNYLQPLRVLPMNMASSYHGAVAAGLFFIYALLRMRFWWASAAGALNVIAYLSFLISFQELPNSMMYSNVAALIMFNILGMAVVYVLERNWRESFLLTYNLQRSESRNRALLTTSPDALLEVDQKGMVFHASPAIASFFDEETLENGVKALWPKDHERITTAIEESLGFDNVLPVETSVVKHGQVRVHELRFKQLDEGRALIVVSDITARKEDERREADFALRAQQKRKLESLGVMAGGITHDFNSLLTVMLGQTELLLSKDSSNKPEELLRIRDAIGKASELTEKMLAYAGKTRMKTRTNDIALLVSEMRSLLEASAHSRAVLEFSLPEELPNVLADRVQVEQVLVNFVTNAAEACSTNGLISIAVGTKELNFADFRQIRSNRPLTEGEYVYLSVTDNGQGMTPETIERVFEPFYSTKFQGRGMGLASVLGIMTAHRGGVLIETEYGKGTMMKAFFPVSSVETSQELSRDFVMETAKWRGGGTILLADDDANVIQVSKLMLENIGFDVIVAEGGEKAVQLYEKHHQEIRLLMLDMTMPDLGGEAVIEQIQSRYPKAKIVINTAYTKAGLNEILEDQTVVAGIIHKPYTLSELRYGLMQVLESQPESAQPPT